MNTRLVDGTLYETETSASTPMNSYRDHDCDINYNDHENHSKNIKNNC